MRLNKILSRVGACSRRTADDLISQGAVKINGLPATLGQKYAPGDRVVLHGRSVAVEPALKRTPRLWMHNKCRGVLVSTRDDQGRPCLLPELQRRLELEHLIPCGRLDFNSEGLLLLTDDGDLAQRILHPSARVIRHYRLRVRGTVDVEALEGLKKGITVRGVHYGRMDATLLGGRQTGTNAWVDVRLREGKNRELRNVFEYGLRLQVSRLVRLGFGPYTLPRVLEKGDCMVVPNLFDRAERD